MPIDRPNPDALLHLPPQRAVTPPPGRSGSKRAEADHAVANPIVLRDREQARQLSAAATRAWREYWTAMSEAKRFGERVRGIWAEAKADYPSEDRVRDSPWARRERDRIRADASLRADLPTELREQQLHRAWTVHPEFLRLRERLRPVARRLEKALRLKIGGLEDERLLHKFRMLDAAHRSDSVGARLAGA